MAPKAPPALVVLPSKVRNRIHSMVKIKQTYPKEPVNKPTARRRKVIVRKAKSTTRPMFFLSEAMLDMQKN
jgi:hypothetical protein